MRNKHQIAPCLWFDHQAEEAAKHYTNIFENSKITEYRVNLKVTFILKD